MCFFFNTYLSLSRCFLDALISHLTITCIHILFSRVILLILTAKIILYEMWKKIDSVHFCASKKSRHSSGRINLLLPINFAFRFIALYIVWVIYLQTGSSLVTWHGDVAAVEDEPEKRLACWWLNCSGIPARYGRCLRYAYIVRYSGFANPVRDSVLRPFTMRNRNFHRRRNLKAIAASLLV